MIAKAPATVPREATDPAHPPASPARYRNLVPARDVETHRPADESAHRIASPRSAQPHSGPRPPPPEPATVGQSAAARRRNPSAARLGPPAILPESFAHSLSRAHQSECPAPSTTRPAK